jgi:hypothetical protein
VAEPTPLPIACTLTGASLAERGAWLRRLGRAALIDGARRGDRLELRFRPEAADDLQELVRAERECCPFLSFEIDRRKGELRLRVTGPAGAGPVLDDLFTALRRGRMIGYPGRPIG